ncbi:putative receptor protein kinase TMK1 [Heracleum sosnowskyi]|uniref:Receptor protein kinase TMK1 n=1 Tax=Heracleum sosnowskyi TaxID=360622 RepID=A0AAD8LZY7_9APIA|nr:putative receptor protein kinase TMK1 [Heracleum sosnowskyi]
MDLLLVIRVMDRGYHSPKHSENEISDEETETKNDFSNFFQDIKAGLQEMMNSLSGFFQNLFAGLGAVDGSAKATSGDKVVGASMMGLAIMINFFCHLKDMGCDQIQIYITILLWLCISSVAYSVTHPGDFAILNDFRSGLENPELLEWPDKGDDPCGPPSWPHVLCSDGRVTQIQVQNMGLKGPLPKNFNQLVKLQNLGMQRNKFNGTLPSFSGLSELNFAFLDFNEFDGIPSDFFHGLSSVRVLALDENPFNASSGWSISDELQQSAQLVNFSCSGCNVVGPLPDFFGKMPSLSLLSLAYNRLSGSIPESFRDSMLQILWLNNQGDGGMTGTIDVIGTMTGLTEVWLHGNQFSGTIPDSIGDLTSLQELNLNGNKLVGLIPPGLANLSLRSLVLDNNMLMGPIPKFEAANVTFSSNSFCQSDPGEQCSPTVNALIDFIGAFGFPQNLVSQWTGNDPCQRPWVGIMCSSDSQVSVINLRGLNLNGSLSPSLANLDSLLEIHLDRNNLTGVVPMSLTELKSLRLLDIKENNFAPPLPKFRDAVKIIIDGNPQLVAQMGGPPLEITAPVAPSTNSSTALLYVYCYKKKKDSKKAPLAYVVHPKDTFGPDDMVKITVASDMNGYNQIRTGPEHSLNGTQNTHVIQDGNAIISVQVLRKATEDFAPKNEIGRGGDDFRAKVSDFGLVKLAPDRERSIATRLAGTFGYLAPEYAVTGKITTKADVFSFGVVLMELLTGLMALDEHRSAETRYLAEWFTQIKSDKKKINDAVDPTIDAKEENFDSISIVADLAGHCTARDPNHRPDMGHVVSVLGQLVEKWVPFDSETEDLSGIDYNLPLTQMLKDWKVSDPANNTNSNLLDSTESIPNRPTGFADSFTSADAR